MNLKTDVLVFNNFYLFWILSFFFFIILGYFKLQKMCVRFGIESFFFSCNYKQSFIKRNAFFVIFFLCPVIILIVIVYNSFSCLFIQIQLLDRKVGFHIIFIFISDHLSINGIHTWLYTFF